MLEVGGAMALDDGHGGVLLARLPLFAAGDSARWMIVPEADGLLEAEFAGDRLLLHASSAGLASAAVSVVAHHDQGARVPGTGRLELIGGQNATTGSDYAASAPYLVATFTNTGGFFTVRRLG